MAWYLYPVVIIVGTVAGFINTLAGSGSLITLPLLIYLGLPANVANGTNRIAIVLQTVVGVTSFYKQKLVETKRGLLLAIPAVLGSVLGAHIAVNMNEKIMRRTLGALMLFMLIVIILKPNRWLEGHAEDLKRPTSPLQYFVFFVIGIYGGFIQAGVGILLLAGLVLSIGYDIIKANAAKLLIILCLTPFALAVFIINGQVQWGIGLLMALGNMIGAWIAARTAVKRGAKFVHWLLIAVVALSGIALLVKP